MKQSVHHYFYGYRYVFLEVFSPIHGKQEPKSFSETWLCTGLIETFKNTQSSKTFTSAELNISNLYLLEQWSDLNDLISKNLNWSVNC